MKNKPKLSKPTINQSDIYYSGDEQQANNSKHVRSASAPLKAQATTKKQTQVKREPGKRSSRKANDADNNMQIKLEPKDIRFIEQIFQKKHGKVLTHIQKINYLKKMKKDTFSESNPYTQLNYNAGQQDQWRDNTKKTLSPQDLGKLKKHFLNIMKMVDRGQQTKYTIRDLSRQFNLDQSAYLQLKRQFIIDPDVSLYVNKTSNSAKPLNQSTNIKDRPKKKYILQNIIQRNPLLTRKQLSQKVAYVIKSKSFLSQTIFPQFQIERILQQEGIMWKKVVRFPESRNFPQNLQRKKVFCQKINYILTETKYKVYFFGLLNFNSFMFRTQGWTKDQYLIQPQINYSFTLMALTERSGQGTWKFQKQVYRQQVFGETVKTLFDLLIPDEFQPKYVVVDFNLFKYRDILKKSRKKYDIQIIWLPPFSDMLNPLQFWFEQIRNSLTKSRKMLQLSQECNILAQKNQVLIKDIYEQLKLVFKNKYSKDFQFTKYFETVAKYHEKALKMQKF